MSAGAWQGQELLTVRLGLAVGEPEASIQLLGWGWQPSRARGRGSVRLEVELAVGWRQGVANTLIQNRDVNG